MTRLFDLNIEKVLDHWEPKHAVRELIANALDEQMLSGSCRIEITKSASGSWHIHDFGRGVRIEHFTQNENPEKQNAEGVIGKFGVGLKDALATLNRHGIQVSISSPHGYFRLTTAKKNDYEEIWTLHISHGPAMPNVVGTEVVLEGISDSAILEAKAYFLHFRPHTLLEETQIGQILQKEGDGAAIFINGVWANSEPNFLFSYNITSLTKAMRLSLNRERVNVGRSMYADRVRQILKLSSEAIVGDLLASEFGKKFEGELPDELQWVDVSSRALIEMGKREKIICLSNDEIRDRPELVEDMKSDGFKIVIINDKEMQRANEEVKSGNASFHTLQTWVKAKNESFQYQFVEPSNFNEFERGLFALTDQILALVGPLRKAPPVFISEIMRNTDVDKTLGVWDPELGAIVIKRTQLKSLPDYAGILLHELAHAQSGASDCTRRFEFELTVMLGAIAQRILGEVFNNSMPNAPQVVVPDSFVAEMDNRSFSKCNIWNLDTLAPSIRHATMCIDQGIMRFADWVKRVRMDHPDSWLMRKELLPAAWTFAANDYPEIDEVTRDQADQAIAAAEELSDPRFQCSEHQVANILMDIGTRVIKLEVINFLDFAATMKDILPDCWGRIKGMLSGVWTGLAQSHPWLEEAPSIAEAERIVAELDLEDVNSEFDQEACVREDAAPSNHTARFQLKTKDTIFGKRRTSTRSHNSEELLDSAVVEPALFAGLGMTSHPEQQVDRLDRNDQPEKPKQNAAVLTAQQKQAISEWVEAGATLNDIQTRLKTDFELSMTYMEVRMLAMEIEVRPKDKNEKSKTVEELVMGEVADLVEAEVDDGLGEACGSTTEHSVNVERAVPFEMAADDLIVPGALVSGVVTFSDGMQANWSLDQTGRLSLQTVEPRYRPPQADVPSFQQGLEKILVKMGLQ